MFLNLEHNGNILTLCKKELTTIVWQRDEGEMRQRVEGRRKEGVWMDGIGRENG